MKIKLVIAWIWFGCTICIGQTDFDGAWVSKEYYDALKSSQSPYLAQKIAPYKVIHIEREGKSDVVKMYEYAYEQTEISAMQYYSYSDKRLSFLFQTFDGELIGDTCKNDCKQLHLSNDSLLVKAENGNSESFVKINGNCLYESNLCVIEQLATNLLLKGKYKVFDPENKFITTVSFDEFGVLKEERYYFFINTERAVLWTFYRENYGSIDFDVMQLHDSKSDSKLLFKWERNKTLIRFWRIQFDEETSEATIGEFAFEFEKIP